MYRPELETRRDGRGLVVDRDGQCGARPLEAGVCVRAGEAMCLDPEVRFAQVLLVRIPE